MCTVGYCVTELPVTVYIQSVHLNIVRFHYSPSAGRKWLDVKNIIINFTETQHATIISNRKYVCYIGGCLVSNFCDVINTPWARK